MKHTFVLACSVLAVPVFVSGDTVAQSNDVAGGMTLRGSPRPYTSNSSLQIFTDALASFYLQQGDCTQTAGCLPLASSMCGEAKGWQEKLLPNGSWADVQYNSTERTDWQAVVHLQRVAIMSRSYASSMCGKPKSDQSLLEASLKAISFWLDTDPKAPQWWWLQFGAPQWVAVSTVVLRDQLSTKQLNQTVEVLGRAKGHFTGQNLLWSLQLLLTQAVLSKDSDTVADQFKQMWGAVTVQSNGGDGIQPDWSEYQHGHVLQSGAYGGDFALNIITYLSMVVGTDYMPDSDVLNIVNSYALEGQRPMVFTSASLPGLEAGSTSGGFFPMTVYDLLVKGREITRNPNGTMLYPASVIQQSAALIAAADPPLPRSQEWKAFADQLAGAGGASNAEGTRHFPYGDYTSHYSTSSSSSSPHRWMQGIKVWSDRTESSECVNEEGQLSWHMSSGITTTYITGAEYLGVFPVWNWTALPGLTAVQGVQEAPCKVKQLGPNKAAGGAALGTQGGVTAFDFVSGNFVSHSGDYSKLTARKTYVHIPNVGTVVLVADLTQAPSASGSKPWVSTTLEQSLLNGDVVVGLQDGSTKTLPPGERWLGGASWVHHAGIAYASLQQPSAAIQEAHGAPRSGGPVFPGDLFVMNRPVTGNWSRISTTQPSTPVVKDVFQASVPHGSGPNGASFAYSILPSTPSAPRGRTGASSLDGFIRGVQEEIEITSNSAHLQSVLVNGTMFASVWEDQSGVPADAGVQGARAGNQMGVVGASGTPFTAIVSSNGDGSYAIGAADPLMDSSGRQISFTINANVPGKGQGAVECAAGTTPGTTKVTVQLPSGLGAGETATGSC